MTVRMFLFCRSMSRLPVVPSWSAAVSIARTRYAGSCTERVSSESRAADRLRVVPEGLIDLRESPLLRLHGDAEIALRHEGRDPQYVLPLVLRDREHLAGKPRTVSFVTEGIRD